MAYNKFLNVTADTQVKAGAGELKTLTFSCNDAAPTAGSIIVYDSLTEAGTIIYSETFTTTAFRGYTVNLDVVFRTGLYVGFTTTADVNCVVVYS
jgi:ABC-type phosphate/phosphonate transport system substrate-binding protein